MLQFMGLQEVRHDLLNEKKGGGGVNMYLLDSTGNWRLWLAVEKGTGAMKKERGNPLQPLL